ncbi:MAG: ABC transporter permease [Candidatus Limnocylindrales bacterium]|jgi:hypothetical protein
MRPQHGPLTEDCDTEVADLVVDLLDPPRARGDRLGRASTSLVGVTLYRTRTGGKRRSALWRALRGEAVADVDMEPRTVRIEEPEALNVTALTSVGFATVLGALAGLMPAVNAARMDPVAALRHE